MKFSIAWVVEKINANRTKHVAKYNKAMEEYKRRAVILLTKRIEEIQSGKVFTLHFALRAPTSKEKDYDAILSMLKFTTGDDVELSEKDYRRYILDQWDWSEIFNNTVDFFEVEVT